MTDEQAVRLAEHCERLLNDEVLAQVLAEMDEELIDQFRRADPLSPSERDTLYWRMNGLTQFKAAMRRKIEAGRVAALRMDAADRTAKARRRHGIAPGDPL